MKDESELTERAEAVLEAFRKRNRTLAVAESCTGGWLSKIITDISGASSVYSGGICTYSNSAKVRFLGVREATLEKYGAVSEQTAREMAEGVKAAFGSSAGIGITGIAGPSSDDTNKPVGLIFVAFSDEKGTQVIKLNNQFRENIRENNRYSAIMTALRLLR